MPDPCVTTSCNGIDAASNISVELSARPGRPLRVQKDIQSYGMRWCKVNCMTSTYQHSLNGNRFLPGIVLRDTPSAMIMASNFTPSAGCSSSQCDEHRTLMQPFESVGACCRSGTKCRSDSASKSCKTLKTSSINIWFTVQWKEALGDEELVVWSSGVPLDLIFVLSAMFQVSRLVLVAWCKQRQNFISFVALCQNKELWRWAVQFDYHVNLKPIWGDVSYRRRMSGTHKTRSATLFAIRYCVRRVAQYSVRSCHGHNDVHCQPPECMLI